MSACPAEQEAVMLLYGEQDLPFSNEALEEVTAASLHPGREDAESWEATSNPLPNREVGCMVAAWRAAQKLNAFRSW